MHQALAKVHSQSAMYAKNSKWLPAHNAHNLLYSGIAKLFELSTHFTSSGASTNSFFPTLMVNLPYFHTRVVFWRMVRSNSLVLLYLYGDSNITYFYLWSIANAACTIFQVLAVKFV